jgi:DNA-binding HxlR family transcriptional regulator
MRPASTARAVRGSSSGRPIMALLDLMGRRMALRILWELHRAVQPLTFRALLSAAETNPALLNTRLKDLRAASLVLLTDAGYCLTDQGRSLMSLMLPLHGWAELWSTPALMPIAKRRTGKPAN